MPLVVTSGYGTQNINPFGLDSAVATPSTTVRVNFSEPVILNEALTDNETYIIDPPLQVFSVVAEPVVNPTYVDLTVSKMKNGQAYTVTLNTVVPV